jgi:Flagellin hook IN motif
MRIGAGSSLGSTNPYSGLLRRSAAPPATKLLIGKFAKGISVSDRQLSANFSAGSEREELADRESVLDRIRNLIEVIQNKALRGTPSNDAAGAAPSASDQRVIDEALIEIGHLIGAPLRLGGTERAIVTGVNDAQIASYEVISLRPNAKLSLSGSFQGARKAAGSIADILGGLGWLTVSTDVSGLNENQIATLNTASLQLGTDVTVSGSLDAMRVGAGLVYDGAIGGLVAGTASFRLTGPQGNANISITSGEALSDVAERINDQTAATGVVAAVQGNSLTLSTVAIGAGATMIVDSVDRESVVSVSGVNGSQVDNFQVVSIPDETQLTLSGNVTQAAARATLTYLGGSGGVVVDSATSRTT